jgi:hypothetical protein
MMFAPTTTVSERLLTERKTAAEEAQLAFAELDNFSRAHLKEGHTEHYQGLVNTCQTGVTAASQGYDYQLCGQVLPCLCETLDSIPWSVKESHHKESQNLRRLATAKFQKLFALTYTIMCASLGDTLPPEEQNNPRHIQMGWYEMGNMYSQ